MPIFLCHWRVCTPLIGSGQSQRSGAAEKLLKLSASAFFRVLVCTVRTVLRILERRALVLTVYHTVQY
jgi:hypothetical protein